MSVAKLNIFLDTYKGRDRILRTLCYTSKCAAGLVASQQLATQLDNFSSQLSACRAALRLLDDIPMLTYVLKYKLGAKEKDKFLRSANVISNIVDLLFGPIDHIAWAVDHNIINTNDTRWGTASTVCWVISLYLNIAKTFKELQLIALEKNSMTGNQEDVKTNLEALAKQQRNLLISATRSAADFIFAVHYLPSGVFWSGALSKWQVGALGSISSILGLYQSFS